MQSLWTGLTGLRASQAWLDQVSNNLANQDTVGFAADASSFADAYTAALNGNQAINGTAGRYTPPYWRGGTGVLSVSAEKDFAQMPLQNTGNPLDFAIQGDGFFVIGGSDGQTKLTKAGNFAWSRDQNGGFFLATQSGEPVLDTAGGRITVSGSGSHTLTVAPNGDVTVDGRASGQRVAIARVSMPGQKLQSVGDNAFEAKPGVTPVVVNAGNNTTNDTIAQGMLAKSNVDITAAMTDMIRAQRMFDLNSEAISFTNKMMTTANSIRP